MQNAVLASAAWSGELTAVTGSCRSTHGTSPGMSRNDNMWTGSPCLTAENPRLNTGPLGAGLAGAASGPVDRPRRESLARGIGRLREIAFEGCRCVSAWG